MPLAPVELPGAATQAHPQTKNTETDRRVLLDSIVTETSKRRESLELKKDEWAYNFNRAKLYAKANLFGQKASKDGDGPTQEELDQAIARAMVRIDLGESMGFGAAESLLGIQVVSDQLAVMASLRAARMQAAGYNWDIQWHWAGAPETTECLGVTLYLFRNGKPLMDRNGQQATVSFLKADALRMKTKIWEWDSNLKKNRPREASILEKDNWRGSPRNMYFARAITNAQRFYAPGVLSASIPSVEEAEDLPSDVEIDRPSFAPGSIAEAALAAEAKLKDLGHDVPAESEAAETDSVEDDNGDIPNDAQEPEPTLFGGTGNAEPNANGQAPKGSQNNGPKRGSGFAPRD